MMTAKHSILVIAAGLVLGAVGAEAATKTHICEAAKNTTAGVKALCLEIEHAKRALGKPHSFAKCESVFMSAFAKAEQLAGPGVCPTEGDAAAIEALIDSCVADVAGALSGSPPPPCQKFPATGQTTAFQADKNDGIAGPVAVPDDGTVEAGATLGYTDNGDGTITDQNTGLMWEKKVSGDGMPDLSNLHDVDNRYLWSDNIVGSETIWDWLDDVNSEGGTGFAGHNDWRVPNVKELESIVDYGQASPLPSIDPIFAPTIGSFYWSSTTRARDSGFAWFVLFDEGTVDRDVKLSPFFVRAVRGGSP